MKKFLLKAFVLTMALIPMSVSAAELTTDSLDKLLALSGLKKQIDEIPGIVGAGFEQAGRQGAPAGDAAAAELKQAILDAFQPAAVLGTVSAEIRKKVSEADAGEMLIWYESDLGRKITKAEEQATTPAGYEEMLRDAQSLLADQQRVAYARRMDSLMKITDLMMQIQESAGVAVFTAIEEVRNPGLPVDVSAFTSQMTALEPQIRANAQQFVTVSLVYSHRTIELGGLENYLTFMAQPSTSRFNESAVSGLRVAFTRSTAAMAQSIVTVLRKHHGDGR